MDLVSTATRVTGLNVFYLGHHWSYKREIGEPQLTFNWSKTFS